MFLSVRLALLLAILSLVVLNHAPAMSVAQPSGPARNIAELRERLVRILVHNGVAGAGVALANRDGIIWADGIGTANLATGAPATADTVFRLGSVSKNVVALAIMEQVEQGHLSLDDRLRDLAPEVPFSNPWEQTHPVSVAQLLEHTTGFEFARFTEGWEQTPEPLLDALALNPRSRAARWPPGTRMSYSNEGYVVAGYLLEKVTGQSFDAVVQAGVFDPLGMTNSAFERTPATAAHLAQGYEEDGAPAPYLEDQQRPAANLLASSADMARYLLFWVRGGDFDGARLLSPAGIERMQQRRTLPYAGPAQQYGLGTDAAEYGGFLAHGHTGYTDGFVASFRYFPTAGVGWVLMLNQNNANAARAEIEDELASFLLQDATPPTPATFTEPADRLASLAGYYRLTTPSDVIMAPLTTLFGGTQVELRGDSLWERTTTFGGLRSLIRLGTWRPLAPTSQDAFRHTDETRSTLYFTTTADGSQALVTEDGLFLRDSFPATLAKRGLLLGAIGLLMTGLLLVPLRLLLALTPVGSALGPSLAWLPLLLLPLSLVCVWFVLQRSPEPLGSLNATTAAIFALSIAFAVISALAICGALWTTRSNAFVLARTYVLLVASASAGLTLFAWRAHWLGLRTWLW